MYFLEEVVLPPGEKIRRIRGYLGLKQYEITGGKVTRNLISYIENGKTKLVKDTAKIIVDSMNKCSEEKKIPLNIDVEYIMRDETSQARILLEKHIDNLKKYIDDKEEFENELSEAKKILRDWDIIDKKAEIYEIAGNYYYKQERIDESYINYLKSLESYIRTSNNLKVVLIYLELGRCAIWLTNYQEAINLNNHARVILRQNDIDNQEIVKRILYNNALAYRSLKKYDKSLAILDELEREMVDDITQKQYLDVLLSKGNCYSGLEDYTVAERIYNEILDITNDKGVLVIEAIAYQNLSDVYIKYNEIERAIESLKKSIEIRLKNNDFYNNSFYLARAYLSLGKLYNDTSKHGIAEENLLIALEEAVKIRDVSLQVDVYKELLNCYIFCNDDKSIDRIVEEVKETATKNSKINEMKDIFFQAAHYYINKDIEKSASLLKFSLNMIT